jgi:hypothetical protein
MTCAKTQVFVTLVATSGKQWTGTNWCRNPQTVCPRAPGEDYTKCKTVCDQFGHAELDAIRLAGAEAKGSTAYVRNHTYFCMACQHALSAAGVRTFSLDAPPPTREESAFRAIQDATGWEA